MHWLQSLDDAVFHFINGTLSNPVFDAIMPFASGKGAMPIFLPLLLLGGIWLLRKDRARGWRCALMLILIIWPGDSFICNTIKHGIARPRPYVTHADTNLPGGKKKNLPNDAMVESGEAAAPRPVGKSGYTSMPSSHAANWFAATMVLFVYFRRSWWVMLPLACLVAFSRIYNGVHYPSDVLAGAILGAGYAIAGIWVFNALWRWAGQRWFPLWWQHAPSLANSALKISEPQSAIANRQSAINQHWLRLGYLFIAIVFLIRLAYISSGTIELSEDEGYQWVWSKHLALSYYSKPPLIAYTQFLGTHLWGDNDLGVRFFSPVLAALTSLGLLRFMARVVSGRAAFALLIAASTAPLLSVGSTLMTIDPLSVAFWTFAMLAGWRAIQPDSTTKDWLWTGLWMGLGFLSKYTELFQWLCWAIFFLAWKPARVHLRRPGPYLALGVNLLCAVPVLIWNAQHHWITLSHVATNAGLHASKQPSLGQRLSNFGAFMGAEAGLLNPIFFAAAMWAMVAFWRRQRNNMVAVYLFCMGAPLFLCYLLWSFHSGIKPNWIAPSVLPLFCLMIVYWQARWKEVARWAAGVFTVGVVLGGVAVVFLHNTDLIEKIGGHPLPPKPEPLTRVRAWKDSALFVEAARQKLETEGGKPAFIICSHYGTTGLFTFYSPNARTNVVHDPLVFYLRSTWPDNQFYFWPGYEQRKGQNAIFVREVPSRRMVAGWWLKWWQGKTNLEVERAPDSGTNFPPRLVEEFESVTNLGKFDVLYHGRAFHTYQLIECRNLR